MADFPTTVNGFNVYKDGAQLIGVSDEISLPDLNSITASITGAGIAGTVEVPVVGHFDALDFQVPFRTLTDGLFNVIAPGTAVDLTLRGSIQQMDAATGAVSYIGMRIVVRGLFKALSAGSVKVADAMSSSVTLGLTYYMVEVDGQTKLEVDKLNSVFTVNGVDAMAGIRGLC